MFQRYMYKFAVETRQMVYNVHVCGIYFNPSMVNLSV